MNSDSILANLRAYVRDIQHVSLDRDDFVLLCTDLAREFESLDHWITQGGALPAEWDQRSD